MRYYSSGMVLRVDSYDAYLIFPNAFSYTVGWIHLINWPPPKLAKPNPKLNGPILSKVSIFHKWKTLEF